MDQFLRGLVVVVVMVGDKRYDFNYENVVYD